jgi:hypothetical protein
MARNQKGNIVPQRKYNPSRGGHAPGYMREAVLTALVENCDKSDEVPWWSRLEITFFSLRQQIRWDTWDAKERAMWLTGRFWNCSDVLPGPACVPARVPQGSTYARLLRQVRADISASNPSLEDTK